jgi:hypothetical protein
MLQPVLPGNWSEPVDSASVQHHQKACTAKNICGTVKEFDRLRSEKPTQETRHLQRTKVEQPEMMMSIPHFMTICQFRLWSSGLLHHV